MNQPLNLSAINKYKSLLDKIGRQMCYKEEEINFLSKEVLETAIERSNVKQHDVSIEVWLSQLMVKRCYRNLTAKLFRETDSRGNITPPTPHNIPLSLWIVFILHTSVGFSVIEIAHILNSTTGQINSKLNKAKMILINAPCRN